MRSERHTHQVKQYYNKNTNLFNKLGKLGGTKNIHASLMADGVTNQQEASDYANKFVWTQLLAHLPDGGCLMDLGCGLGGTLLYLAHRDATYRYILKGITVSNVQAKRSRDFFLKQKKQVQIVEGDYHNIDHAWAGQVDMAWAIESFVHSSLPQNFFQEVHKILNPGCRLIIIDTFPTCVEGDLPHATIKYFKDYQTYWGAGQILTKEECIALAHREGFTLAFEEDVTSKVDKARIRDKWIGLMNRYFRKLLSRHHYLRTLRGGHAVQMGFKQGWLSYQFLVFQKEHL